MGRSRSYVLQSKFKFIDTFTLLLLLQSLNPYKEYSIVGTTSKSRKTFDNPDVLRPEYLVLIAVLFFHFIFITFCRKRTCCNLSALSTAYTHTPRFNNLTRDEYRKSYNSEIFASHSSRHIESWIKLMLNSLYRS